MTRTEKILTNSWQAISTGPCTIQVEKQGDGALMVNDAQSETAAWKKVAEPNTELRESANRTLYAKGEGYIITVDPQGV